MGPGIGRDTVPGHCIIFCGGGSPVALHVTVARQGRFPGLSPGPASAGSAPLRALGLGRVLLRGEPPSRAALTFGQPARPHRCIFQAPLCPRGTRPATSLLTFCPQRSSRDNFGGDARVTPGAHFSWCTAS